MSLRSARVTGAVIAALAVGIAARAESVAKWQSPIGVASGEAQRGPWKQNASDYRWVDDGTVDLAADGDAVVAWVDQSKKDVFFQRYARDGKPRLAAPSAVSRTPESFSWLPRVLVDRDDANRVYVSWQEIVFSGGSHGGEIMFGSSQDGGRTFRPPVNLSNSAAGDGKGRLEAKTWDNGSLDLVWGSGGVLYAAWTEYEGALWLRRSSDRGATFDTAVRVGGTPEAPARGPSVAVDGGVVHVAWAVGESKASDIHFATSRDGGRTFEAERVILDTSGHSDAPRLAVDGAGTVHLVWAELPSGGKRSIQYTRMKKGAKGFEAPRGVSTAASSGHFPQLSVAGSANVYVVWEQYVQEDQRPQALAFIQSTDGGDHFAAPAAVPSIAGPKLGSNGSQQGGLGKKLAVDASGVAIVNSTFRAGAESHVWLLRGRF